MLRLFREFHKLVYLVVSLFILVAGMVAIAQQSKPDNRSWYQAYADGTRAVALGNWTVAVPSLELAKKIGPRSGRGVSTYGDNSVDFLPDYYLGLAYSGAGRFADADVAFKRVGAGLITSRDKEYSSFVAAAGKASFEALMVSAEEEVQAKRFENARETANRAGKVKPGADLKRVESMLARIDTATRVVPPPPTETKKVAEPPVLKEADTKAPPAQTEVKYEPTATVPNNAEPTKTAAKPPVKDVQTKSPARKPPVVAPPTPAGLPVFAGGERAGMARFFAGDYASAVTLLEGEIAGPRQSRAAHFYLACSIAALVLSGNADPNALAGARQHMAAAGNPAGLTAARQYISPRVLGLLDDRI